MINFSKDYRSKLPVIKRARGFRLYTQDGKRLVDLWQCGGEAILGHKPNNLLRDLKNTAERGLFAPFPNPQEKRLLKALEKLFPKKSFRLYTEEADLHNAVADYYSAVKTQVSLPIWLPFSGFDCSVPLFKAVLPWTLAPKLLVLDNCLSQYFPPSKLISTVILSAATRAVYDLLAAPERGVMRYKKIKILFEQDKIKKRWLLNGIYLNSVNKDQNEWELIHKKYLHAGFLLPPTPELPLILPGELSNGEESALAAALNSI
ncbi:hypothetical protein AGMMS50212_14390 [Spirochaetia bacterium]|nr:hypothetical protein AGMMS50212_14390 [Spirochaetia bacterium]